MLCQSCNEREANVHITKIINGVKTEMHLCDECAKAMHGEKVGLGYEMGMPLSFQNILDGFVEMMGGFPQSIIGEKTCPLCKMTFEDFRRNGRIGCDECYKTFKDEMIPLIRRIHGNIQHNGKLPRRTGGILKYKRDIDRLKDELKNAVSKEEFERAAKIRDEIKELEMKLKEEENRG
ncbi:excinuclease Uvr [Fervidicella metallireducens AeB]|uniref:Excinuclease Uvr n=1 Tax=Fervidicella metallireducens AeB TaxID=1403537 RepID=A0A017RX06_9CLOT|nr:UvrB/UvrC motif-containing protein [Fervidicella metallireducens]EYE88934.1 excinuclease Uvr [Fervidicella metallireducens AeB]